MQANAQAQHDPDYAQSQTYKDRQNQWGSGSAFQQGAQAATAALQGLAGGNLNAALSGAAAPYLAGVIKNLTTDNPQANIIAHALLGAALAQAQDQNAAAGAAGGAAAPIVATLLINQLYPGKSVEQLSEPEKQTLVALTTLAGSLAGSLVSGDTAGALTAGQAAKNEVENNYLSATQDVAKKQELGACKTLGCKLEVHSKWTAVSVLQESAYTNGLIAGVPTSLYDAVAGITNAVTSPVETYVAIRALLSSDDLLGTVSSTVKQSYLDRIDRMEVEYQRGGINGAFNAGVEAGKLLTDVVGLAAGGAGVAKTGASFTQKIITIVKGGGGKVEGVVGIGKAVGGAQMANGAKGTEYLASNVANASKLADQLTLQSAKSPFTAAGTLTQDAINGSKQIFKPEELNNPAIPPGFGKYVTDVFHSPAGDFTTHFYKNPTTGEVFYGLDYKAIFNSMSGEAK